ERLTAAVQSLRAAASEEAFGRIVTTVQSVVRDEWVQAVGGLIGQAETWSRERDWAVRRSMKALEEPLLGRYEAPELLIHLPEGRFMLTPVSRFAAGGTGLVDLYVMPGLGGRSVVRRGTGWVILPARPAGRPKEWSAAAFETAIRELTREAA